MTTSTAPSKSASSSSGVAQYRVIADVAQRWLALLGVVLCALQIGLAAYGFWDAQANGSTKAATRAAFEPHGMNGDILQYLAVVVLILGIIARSNLKAWIIPIILAILLFVVQGLLVGLGFEVSPWFGFTHAISGTVITAGFVWLLLDRWRHPLRATK